MEQSNIKLYSMNIFQKIGYRIARFFCRLPKSFPNWIFSIGRFFRRLYLNFTSSCYSVFRALIDGDIFTKLSFLILGAGCFKRKQYIRGAILTVLEALFIVLLFTFMIPNLSKLNLENLVLAQETYNPVTGKNEWNDFDNSFLILLYSIISILIIIGFFIVYISSIKSTYNNELISRYGGHINSFKEDCKQMIDKKIHITLLFLPILGVLVFTIIPLIFMVFIAFTNYDVAHLPPTALFKWVGFDNFAALFGGQLTSANFSYAFGMIFYWTILWAVLATATTYIGGILLAMLISNKRTKLKKMWRTIFVITIAIPQFVTLMLISYFLDDNGILNGILNQMGALQFFKDIGWIPQSYNYFPFLSDPNWIKGTVVVVNCWVGFPYLMLIATGILINIPKDLYESATIDGASKFKMFTKITMPYMLFVTGPYLISQFTGNLNNFNVIYLLTNGYTTTNMQLGAVSASEADLLVTWLFKLTVDESNYKMASVIGISIFAVSAIFTLIAFKIVGNRNSEEKFQ